MVLKVNIKLEISFTSLFFRIFSGKLRVRIAISAAVVACWCAQSSQKYSLLN